LDSFALNIDERLRPWHDAGLRFLLVNEERHAREDEKAVKTAKPPTRAGTSLKTIEQQPAKPSRLGAADTKTEQRAAPADDSAWPTPWDVYRTRLSIPSKSVWTYWDLGYDMAGMVDESRKALFSKILAKLGQLPAWSRGCATFWPVAGLAAGEVLIPDIEMFWKGVELSRARRLFVFGRRAHDALFPGSEFTFRVTVVNSLECHVFPGPLDLLENRQGSKKIVWDALRMLRP
jgi:hypothetical protein